MSEILKSEDKIIIRTCDFNNCQTTPETLDRFCNKHLYVNDFDKEVTPESKFKRRF